MKDDMIRRLVRYRKNVYKQMQRKAKQKDISVERLAQIYIEEGLCWDERV